MIALFGPIPQEIVDRERKMRQWRWAPEVVNAKGEVCSNAADFYGGPFFNGNGKP